jgi:hypothetical protein
MENTGGCYETTPLENQTEGVECPVNGELYESKFFQTAEQKCNR